MIAITINQWSFLKIIYRQAQRRTAMEIHAWKKWATWRPGRRETVDVSGKFEGKNDEEKGKEEGKIGKERERRGKKENEMWKHEKETNGEEQERMKLNKL